MAVSYIPAGYHSVTPYLYVRDAAAAIDFYARAFGAVERFRMPGEHGEIHHAEVQIGDGIIMLADEMPERGYRSPQSVGGATVGFVLYLPDVDAAYAQAVAAGGEGRGAPETKFYGDRSGSIRDPFGFEWFLTTHLEDVSEEEMHRRMRAQGAQ